MRALFAVLMLLVAVESEAACVRKTPFVSVAEQVQLAQPGDVLKNRVIIRNTDSCDCSTMDFQLSTGIHPPASDPNVRVDRTRLVDDKGRAMSSVRLKPGEEVQATLEVYVSTVQDEPGYTHPVVEATRPSLPRYALKDGMLVWGPGYFEREGQIVCHEIGYFDCRELAYEPGGTL